jgi:hypothetical protein
MSAVEGGTDMALKASRPPTILPILWYGLAHVRADRSPGARLLLHLADVRPLADDRFAPKAVIACKSAFGLSGRTGFIQN